MDDDSYFTQLYEWKYELLYPVLDELWITDYGFIYNADQTRLMYNKIPDKNYLKSLTGETTGDLS